MNLRTIAIVTALLAAPLSPSAFAHLDASLDLSAPPPAPLDEAVPGQPGPGYVWSPGYWSRDDGHYAWVAGAWMLPGYDYGMHFRVHDSLHHGFEDHGPPEIGRHEGDRSEHLGEHLGEHSSEHLGMHIGHEGGHRR